MLHAHAHAHVHVHVHVLRLQGICSELSLVGRPLTHLHRRADVCAVPLDVAHLYSTQTCIDIGLEEMQSQVYRATASVTAYRQSRGSPLALYPSTPTYLPTHLPSCVKTCLSIYGSLTTPARRRLAPAHPMKAW